MSSPDRMAMLADAVGNLVQAMRLMDAEQQSHSERIRVLDERVRELEVQGRQNRARISEIIVVLTEMQTDIARLDAAS